MQINHKHTKHVQKASLSMHMHAFCTHIHQHTLVLVLVRTCITTARIGYVASIQGVSQQKATRQVAPLAAVTPASSPQLHGPLSAVGVLIYGLARPMK